ncbi:hypothetical protein [Microbacterium kunmingense]|uniref:hypothetical protein n=1 Tax=Microbacterium kunmingense TaxID=2915939 RepID=UPI003D73069B
MTRYAWMLQQVPVIVAHLRDSMLPIAATDYDRTRVDGTRDQPLPFRLEPMQDADDLWAALTAYGRDIAWHIQPSPHALTTRLNASQQWHEAGDAAYTITAWLTAHEERIATLEPDPARDTAADGLFLLISQLLNRYRITPRRLRSHPTRCVLCGNTAVHAEWTLNREGDIAQTVQCTVCLRRYDPQEVTCSSPTGKQLAASTEAS